MSYKLKRLCSTTIAVLLLLVLLPMQVSAAATGTHTPVEGVTVGVSGATDNSMSSGAVTVTAKGSPSVLGFGGSTKTATITITNEKEKSATLSFDWTATSVNQLKIDGTVYSGTSGSFSKSMDAGAIITITVTTAKNSTTNKLVMSNFSIVEVAENANVTVQFNSGYSVSVDGVEKSNGDVVNATAAGVTLKANTSNFVAWVNTADHTVLSKEAEYLLKPTGDMTVKAINSTNACFGVDNKVYETLTEAATEAAAGTIKTIVLLNNGTLPAGDYTIPAGVTLLIPYNASNTLCTTEPTITESSYAKPTVYRKLTMANGAKIAVNGALSLSATQTSSGGLSSPVGACSFIQMNSGSTITVNSGGKLYAWGYIQGSGAVTVEEGGTVYECFQIMDWRGGTNTSNMIDNAKQVFPFSEYYVQNIEVPMTIKAGAVESGFTSVNITLAGVQKVPVPFIGTNGMFNISRGYIVKDYDESTGRLLLDLYGDIAVKQLQMTIKLSLTDWGSTKIDSSKYTLPINGSMNITVHSGNSTITQNLALLPGAKLVIGKNANVTLGSGNKVYVYDFDEWQRKDVGADGKDPSFCGTAGATYVNLKYPASATNVTGRTEDAYVEVNGTADLSAGYVYTTAGGANICSTGTGAIKLKAGTDTKTYQSYCSGSDDKTLVYVDIPITSAKLKNGNGDYVATEAGDYVYDATHQRWALTAHTVTDEVTNPTCTEAGYTTHTCSCGYSYKDSDTEALGHTAVSDANPNGDPIASATPATCTDDGVEFDYWKCTREGCGVYYKVENDTQIAVEENAWVIPALGHEYTVSENGYTWADDYSKVTASGVCSRDVNHVGEIDSINVTSATTNATCSAPGETVYTATFAENTEWKNLDTQTAKVELRINENAHEWDNDCDTICNYNESHTRKITHAYGDWIVDTAATCTTAGSQHKECAICDHTVTEAIDALGHNMVSVEAKAATCTEAGYNAHTDCSRCDYTEGKSVISATGHNYGNPTYTGDGKTSYVATRECTCGDTQTATAGITSEVTKAATCTAEGETTYTADFAETWAEDKTTTESISKLPHSYGEPQFTWNGYECTAKVICSCGDEQGVDVTVTSAETTEATCTVKGVKTYTATAVWNEQTYTSAEHPTEDLGLNSSNHKNITNHEQTDATCTEVGYTAGTYCEDCKQWISGHEEISQATHNYGDPTYTGDGKTSYVATRECTCGDTQTATAGITSEVTKAATCTAEGETTYTADFAETWAEDKTTTEPIAKLAHSYGEPQFTWNGYACTAKVVCSCGDEQGVDVTVTSAETTEATCTVKGVKTYTATAVWNEQTYTSAEHPTEDLGLNSSNHKNITNHEQTDATCTSNGYTAGVYCNDCEKWISGHEKIPQAAHSHDDKWKYDETNHWHECVCGDKADLAEHGWDAGVVTTQPTISAAGVKTYTCGTCGTTRTETIDKLTGTTVYLDVLTNNLATGPQITLLSGTTNGEGWDKEGNVIAGSTVDFSVTFDKACVVIVETTDTDGNLVYTKVPAVATADKNTYTFSTNVVEGMKIIVAVKGDVDGSGVLDAFDKSRLAYATLPPFNKDYDPLSGVYATIADMTEDGFVDAFDKSRLAYATLPPFNKDYDPFSW